MTSDDLRERGIEYLVTKRSKEKQPHELGARELAPIVGISESSIYSYMMKLVASGEWGTRVAFDPETHKTIKVWWLK